MKKVLKGEFGYINYRKKTGILRTAVLLAVLVLVFVLGLVIFGSSRNYLSILAALLSLPTGWSGVNMIMFLRAKPCSDADHEVILQHAGSLLIHYDHLITSYDRNFCVSASTVLDKNIICYLSDDDSDPSDLEKHIKKMMAQNGYSSYSVKVFDDLKKFCERLTQLESLRKDKKIDPVKIENDWVPGTVQTPAGILISISL
ncbi:MAG: hypothetical protein IJ695_04885 [Butyrivibrio sp.]|nr:hypothetical protein [Butyrivibrio sp.]